MKKTQKGNYEYLNQKKKWEIGKTVALFALSVTIFLVGYFTTKTKANLLTVVAVLGCLPACKCAVNMIMVLRIKHCTAASFEKISKAQGRLNGYYHLYFTSYDKNYSITHLVVTSNSIIAYSESTSIKEADFTKHLNQLIAKDGIKDITIKLFTDLEKYCMRLEQLNEGSVDINENVALKNLLFSVSL